MFTLSNEAISKAIREKKKKLSEAPPELVDTDAMPDLNPMDMYNVEQHARVESTLGSPPKINADKTMMDETYHGVGVSPVEKGRMDRLRKYIGSMELSDK